jgi:hypothetical protein
MILTSKADSLWDCLMDINLGKLVRCSIDEMEKQKTHSEILPWWRQQGNSAQKLHKVAGTIGRVSIINVSLSLIDQISHLRVQWMSNAVEILLENRLELHH